MTNFEAIFFWIAIWCYGLSAISFLAGVVFKKEKPILLGRYLSIIGLSVQTVSIVIRWIHTGHPPVMGVFENSMLSGWFIMTLYMITCRWSKKVEIIGVAVMPVVLLMLGNGVMTGHAHEPLAPPYQSNWLWLHVFFAWVAYGAFCLAAGLGLVYLLKKRAETGKIMPEFYNKLPDLEVLNEIMLKVVVFGFTALTVEIGAGALWAYNLWGRYWGWDPIETWSLITWLIYGTVIHLGFTLGWKGSRLARLMIAALLSVFITFGGLGYMSGVHTVIL